MGGKTLANGYIIQNEQRTQGATRPVTDVLSPVKTANFLLHESRERGDVLTNLKLQKLLYYAQAWFLALNNDKPLFGEDFRAWVHGPVLLTQYHRFKDAAWRPIYDEVERPDTGDALAAHLLEIVDVFGVETAVALEVMTHNEKPWLEARGNLPPDAPSSAIISKKTMAEFYRSL